MRKQLLLILVLAACGKDASAPTPKVDPPAEVHAVNRTGTLFHSWDLTIGADMLHSGVGSQGEVQPESTAVANCAYSGQVPGERRDVRIAVIPASPLESLLTTMTNGDSRCSSCRPVAVEAVLDSLARGTLSANSFLARSPGLIAATEPYDAAPIGWPPTATVPWTWTVTGIGRTTIAVDTSDHACLSR